MRMAPTAIRQQAERLVHEAETFSLTGIHTIKGPAAIAAAILDLADAVRELAGRR